MGKLLETYKEGFIDGTKYNSDTVKPGNAYPEDRVKDNSYRKGHEDGKKAFQEAVEKVKPIFDDK